MGILYETMTAESRRRKVVNDYVLFIHAEVKKRRGVAGSLIRTAYAAFTTMKRGHMEESVNFLLPPFMEVLDGYFEDFAASGGKPAAFPEWIAPRALEVADRLLAITDAAVAASGKVALQKAYALIRAVARKNVAEAIPGMAAVAVKHMAAA